MGKQKSIRKFWTFLAIAEELKLKGLMGKSDDAETTEKETSNTGQGKNIDKKEKTILKSAASYSSDSIFENTSDNVGGIVATRNHFSGDLSELEVQTISLMHKTSKMSGVQPIYICKVCGKEDMNRNLKTHIEANHLEGVSIPCNFCEKTFRSRKSLKYHTCIPL